MLAKNYYKKIIQKINNKVLLWLLLYIAQRQNNNWIPLAAMKYIGKFLDMPYIKVYEVATFYSMYNLAPVGKYFFQVCTTTPCMIRGAISLLKFVKKKFLKNENEFLLMEIVLGWKLNV